MSHVLGQNSPTPCKSKAPVVHCLGDQIRSCTLKLQQIYMPASIWVTSHFILCANQFHFKAIDQVKKLFTWLRRWFPLTLQSISHWQQFFSRLLLPSAHWSLYRLKKTNDVSITEAKIRRESRTSVTWKEIKGKPSKNNSYSQENNWCKKTCCYQTTNFQKKMKACYGWFSNFALILVTVISSL